MRKTHTREDYMPNVGGVKYPYTKKGKAAAAKAKGKMKPKAKPRKGK